MQSSVELLVTGDSFHRRMPDIDTLMQEWPGEVEELLKEVNLPTAALELELSDYVDIICGECCQAYTLF